MHTMDCMATVKERTSSMNSFMSNNGLTFREPLGERDGVVFKDGEVYDMIDLGIIGNEMQMMFRKRVA